jgi:K+-transporting ATPase ATPase A chain
MVKDTRQGWAVLAAMTIVFVGYCSLRHHGTGWQSAGCRRSRRPARERQPGGGNMEGKEVRFGVVNSALWAHRHHGGLQRLGQRDARLVHAAGGLVPLWLMQLGEIIYGGVGSGLYGMLLFAIVTVFIAGSWWDAHRSTSARKSRPSR